MRAPGSLALTALLLASAAASAQVAPEPSMTTADLHGSYLVQAHLAVPEDQFLLGGMLRFPITEDLDLGARVGVGFVDGGEDYVWIGGDGRYALITQRFTGAGPTYNLTFHSGLGVVTGSGLTRWKIPVGFPTGLTFGLVSGSLEVYTHPRLELGFQSGAGDDSDLAVTIDLGGHWRTGSTLGVLAAVRFGDGIFDESDRGVFGAGISARF